MYIPTETSTVPAAAAILIGAAVLHASFQLSTSVMTLLSGHTLGFKRSHTRLMHLCSSYIGGNLVGIALLLFAAHYIVNSIPVSRLTIWAALSALGFITAVITLLFYHSKKRDRLWIPEAAAQYLYERSKKTKRGFEAFGLGMVTGVAELPFIAAPLLLAATTLRSNPDAAGLGSVLVYSLVACLPLLVVFVLIGSGKRVSQLEYWREKNRRFLQLMSGAGLLVLSLYVFSLFYAADIGVGL